jgi:D-cysteine desulfhydrase
VAETLSGNQMGTRCVESKAFPLFDRFPELAVLPRVELGTFPTPVTRVELPEARELWLKRDDQNAVVVGGNKVRALEFLLGSLAPGEVVVTAGGMGSNHVYATAVHAARLGGRTIAARWPHEMGPEARTVSEAARAVCATTVDYGWIGGALIRVAAWRVGAGVSAAAGTGPGAGRRYLPIGGSTPLGILGHVNAGLELGRQIAAGDLPDPSHVVVPLGSGGTAAGLSLGLGITGSRATVVAARVAPRVVANITRIRVLIERTRRLMRRISGVRYELSAAPVLVDHTVYGGAYGRPLAAGDDAAALLRGAGSGLESLTLDSTYAAKAAATALAIGGDRTVGRASTRVMLWVTFDGRVVPTR